MTALNGLLKHIGNGINMNTYDIARMDKSSIQKTYAKLIVQKMHLDKWFSDFLAEKTLDHDNIGTPEWKTYKKSLEEYQELNNLIKHCEYQMGKR
jgi:hypothetical protein